MADWQPYWLTWVTPFCFIYFMISWSDQCHFIGPALHTIKQSSNTLIEYWLISFNSWVLHKLNGCIFPHTWLLFVYMTLSFLLSYGSHRDIELQVLACMIRQQREITGIQIWKEWTKLSLIINMIVYINFPTVSTKNFCNSWVHLAGYRMQSIYCIKLNCTSIY